MKLYLDLNKAVSQVPSTGTDHRSGERASKDYDESFTRVHTGVAGGDPTADKPEVGRRWSHSDEDDDDKSDNEILKESTSKAQEAVDILKSLSTVAKSQLTKALPNERETEYLVHVCGYEMEDVIKGRARIVGHERDRFNSWLHKKLLDSIGRLSR